MRKVLSIAAVLFLGASIAGCGDAPTATPVAATATVPVAAAATDTVPAMVDATATVPAMVDATATTASVTGTMSDTSLSAIKARGKLRVGVKFDQPGFGFLNPATNEVEGFDIEFGKAVAEKIFGDASKVEFKESISANRIPYLNDSVVDLVFATMTANEDRAKQIDFTDLYYVAGQSLLVPIDSTITDLASLAGKTVGTVSGSTSEKNIREKAPDATVELFGTYSEAVQAMQSGRVDAVTTDDAILYGFANKEPEKFKVVGGQFTKEPYAGGLKKGNSELLALVNEVIRETKSSGKWAEWYKTWISATNTPEIPPQEWRDALTPNN
jgi:aspartate/glutamate/glutamine transport system substrate-binding protein